MSLRQPCTWQELVELCGTWAGVVHEFLKHPLEVGIRICASATDLLDKGVDDGTSPAGVFAANKHPVLVSELGGAYRVWVLVDQSAPSIKVNVTVFKDAASRGHSAWA